LRHCERSEAIFNNEASEFSGAFFCGRHCEERSLGSCIAVTKQSLSVVLIFYASEVRLSIERLLRRTLVRLEIYSPSVKKI